MNFDIYHLSFDYFHLFFSPYPFALPPGQQEDEEDARGGTAGKERAGEDCEESSEEHERPDLGRNKPLSLCLTLKDEISS